MVKDNREKEERLPIEDWEEYYQETGTEELPWYSAVPDPEVIEALKSFCPPPGARVLDLGAGPGTMAIEFARMGYEVTACDISSTALTTAKLRAEESALADKINFLVCDIRKPLEGEFEIINDRGCFHVMRGDDKQKYIDNISALMAQGAVLLLKTFSTKEPGDEGPCRYSVEDIKEIFSDGFDLIFSRDTIFQSTMEEDPKAILSVLKRSE
jgi:cyclopropane fatty-acyl-phospholipid synthase-like methyltransferase